MSSNIKTVSHFGSQHSFGKLDIDRMELNILFFGYKYKDTVRGKYSIVNEVSYNECFPCLDSSSLEFTVGKDAVSCAKILYNAAKDAGKSVKIVNGIYIVEDYVDLVKKAEDYKKNGTGSNRNTIIYFKPNHCFQSMQFMKGNDSGKVIVNMRSCNLTENFLIDLALSWIVADKVFNYEYSEIDVIMNIASLHILEPVWSLFLKSYNRKYLSSTISLREDFYNGIWNY